jgi:exonuclease III/ribonuclease HI
LNVQGLSTAVQEVTDAIHQQELDVLVLTETKANTGNMKYLRRSLRLVAPEYRQHYSIAGRQRPQAGVTILIHRKFADIGLTESVPTDEALNGYIKAISIHMPVSTPITVVGVYMPSGRPGDAMVRQQIYKEVSQIVKQAQGKDGNYTVMVAGDFNATLYDLDRVNGKCHEIDKEHRRQVSTLQLHSLEQPQPGIARPLTWRKGIEQTPQSRIDDILANDETLVGQGSQVEVVDLTGGTTDHNMVVARIQYSSLNILPPPDVTGTEPEVRYKVKPNLNQEEQVRVVQAVQEQWGAAMYQTAQKLERVVAQQVSPYWQGVSTTDRHKPLRLETPSGPTTGELVETYAAEVMDILHGVRNTVWDTAPKVISSGNGLHRRPRGATRQRRALIRLRQDIVRALQSGENRDLQDAQGIQKLAQIQQENPHKDQETVLHDLLRDTAKEIRAIDRKHSSRAAQEHIQKLRALIDRKQKVGNKIITGQYKGTNSMALKVIEVDGQTHTTPEDVIEATTRYYTRKMVPATGVKHGKYYPEEQPRRYPWEQPDALDPFALATHASQSGGNRNWLHKQMADQQAFTACIKTLSKGKAPGPDQVTNEMLRLLPLEGKKMLHALTQIMWATAHTPQQWKHSITVLLYKNKGTPLQLDYYRRVGLENTVYKLWTRMVTWAMTHHAETHNILTQTQAGFRTKRTTADQVELLQMVLEDAMMTRQDVFLTMMDATEAFDTVDHDKMLQVLFDLGFPLDAIEVVKQLYTGTTTSFKTPYGDTSPIPLQRGTIQGDSLSPFLYITYTEPLLRWLRVGAKGYKPGAFRQLTVDEQVKLQIPDITYADDLNLLTGTVADMTQQVRKVQAYADWAHLILNRKKTMVTAATYRTNPKDPYNNGILQRRLQKIQLHGKQLTYTAPDEPFKFLGVHFTMTMNMRPQFEITMANLKDMLLSMARSVARPYQQHRTLMGCVRAKLRYALCLAPYNMAQLGMLDSQMAKAAKLAHGLKPYIANAWAHEDVPKGGLGCHSLQVEYHEIQVQRLIHALNDQGILGKLTRASMEGSKSLMDKLTADMYPAALKYNLRLRQQVAMAHLDMEIVKDGQVTHTMQAHSQLFTDVAKLADTVSKQPPPMLIRDLYELQKAGICHFADLVRTHSCQIMTSQELRRRHKMTARQCTAAQRIAHTLTQDPMGADWQYGRRVQESDTKTTSTDIHYAYRRALRGMLAMTQDDIRNTPIGALWDVRVHQPHTEEAITAIQSFARDAVRRRVKGSDIREQGQECQSRLKRRGEDTGFQVYTRLMSNPTANKHRLMQLYRNYAAGIDTVKGVVAEATATKRVGRGTKRRCVAKQAQQVISWEDTIMQGWMVDIARRIMGYQPVHVREATVEEVQKEERVATECCGPDQHNARTKGSVEPTALICDGCQRAYHVGCMICPRAKEQALQAIAEDTEWSCRECKAWRDQHQTPNALVTHYVVKWADSVEDKQVVQGDSSLGEQLSQYADKLQTTKQQEQDKAPQGRNKHNRANLRMNNLQKQGDYGPGEAQRYNTTMGDELRTKLQVDPQPLNPHTDIHPTGQYEVFVRPILQRHGRVTSTTELACIYTPDGKCRHQVTVERAALLWAQFNYCLEQKPRLTRRLKAGTFAEELHKLMLRYENNSVINQQEGTRVKLVNHWATPRRVYAVLQSLAGVTKERYASPLNYNPDMDLYWSVHKRDVLFGARHDTYAYTRTGSSVANPEYEDPEMNKSVAEAVWAARNNRGEPTLEFHVLPAWTDTSNTAYMNWLDQAPEVCKHVLQIPKQHFRFQTPTAWKTGTTYDGNPKWGVNILVTGNQAGLDTYFPYGDDRYMTAFYKDMQEAINSTLPTHKQIKDIREFIPKPRSAREDIQQRPPHLLRRMGYPKRGQKRKQDVRTDTDKGYRGWLAQEDIGGDLQERFRNAMGRPPPLRYDWTEYAYTDGSVLKCAKPGAPRLGAGVYVPENTGAGQEERKVPILPHGPQAMQNTINRAELVGILTALQMGMNKVLTDSACSIYQIHKHMTRPQDHSQHQHKTLLGDIVQLIQDSPRPVYIGKVKSHTGVVGNEVADEIAVAVAKGKEGEEDDMDDVTEYGEESNDRGSLYWPAKVTQLFRTMRDATTGEPKKVPSRKKYKPLQDLKKDTHEVSRDKRKMGSANRDTIRFEAWDRQTAIRHKATHHFVATTQVKHTTKVTALKYRTGCLFNRKLAYMFKMATSPNCVLCGQMDGGHHIASGCPNHTKLYTDRHNKAVRMIIKSICQGRKGGFLVMADAGRKEKCQQDGIPHLPRSIPAAALPAAISEEVKRVLTSKSRPDAFLYKPAKSQGGSSEYTIVEVKYCRDTDPDPQLQRAEQQHKELADTIQSAEPTARVRYLPVLLGVAGTVYITHTTDHLEQVGIVGAALTKLVNSLNEHAVESLHWIYTTKRKQEQPLLPLKEKGGWKRRKLS